MTDNISIGLDVDVFYYKSICHIECIFVCLVFMTCYGGGLRYLNTTYSGKIYLLIITNSNSRLSGKY